MKSDVDLSSTMVAMFSFISGPPRRNLLSNVWSPVPAHKMGMGKYLLVLKKMEGSHRLGRENLILWVSVEVLLT